MRREFRNHVCDLEFLERPQRPRFMIKVGLMARRVVGIVSRRVTQLHPHRLFGQFARGLEIIGTQFLRSHIVVGLQSDYLFRLVVGFSFLVTVIHYVGGAAAGNHDGRQQNYLQFFSRLGSHGHDLHL